MGAGVARCGRSARGCSRPRGRGRRGRRVPRQRGFQALDARHQGAGAGVDLGGGGLDQRRLQAGARVGPVLDRAQGLGQEVEQAHEARARHARGLLGEALVDVGGQAQLGGHLAQRLHDEQVARVGLEVLEELGDVAAGVGQARGGEPGGAGVAGGHGVEGLEEQVRVGDAEHGEDVLGGDVGARVGHELLERAQRVAERAGRVAGEQGDGVGRDLDRLGGGHARDDDGDLLDRRAREVEAVAAVDDRRQHLLGLGRGEDEDRVAAAAPRAS